MRTTARRRVRRAIVGGCALGLATGWNISNTGAVASPLAIAYGVSLAVVGLFTTALFVTHIAVQIPGAGASDRFGSAGGRASSGSLVIIVLQRPVDDRGRRRARAHAPALTGLGTGLAFIAGSAYIRAIGRLAGGAGAVRRLRPGRRRSRARRSSLRWRAGSAGGRRTRLPSRWRCAPCSCCRGARRDAPRRAARAPRWPDGRRSGTRRSTGVAVLYCRLARPQRRHRQLGRDAARPPRRARQGSRRPGRGADARARRAHPSARRLDSARTPGMGEALGRR